MKKKVRCDEAVAVKQIPVFLKIFLEILAFKNGHKKEKEKWS